MRANRNNQTLSWLIVFFGLLALGGVTWGNLNYARQNSGGNDFLAHWVGAQALLEDGLSPYSDETALRIQNFAYGRPAQAGENEMRVAYPLYSVYLFVPFALVKDYATARALWMTLLEAALVGMVFLSLSLYRWRPRPVVLAVLLLFSIFWYPGLRALINGNAVVVVALLVTGGLLAMREGADELAGVLFAFSTIKPQVVVLLLAFVVIWCLGQRRWRVLGWLAATFFLLVTSAALIFPDWLLQNLREVMRYPSYNPPGSPGAVFATWWPAFGQRLGWVLSGILAILLLAEWWTARKAGPRGFLWAAGFTLVASQWIGIQTDPGNFIVLFPVLLMTLALLDEHWKGRGSGLVLFLLGVVLVSLWAIFLGTVEYGDQPAQSPVMFFPLPAMLFLLLYWVRWWAVRPLRPWLDQFE